MKKVLVILMVVLLAFSGSAFAKKKSKKKMSEFEKAVKGVGVDWVDDKSNIITTSPVGLIFSVLNAHYEMKMSKGNGLGFNGYFNWYDSGGWGWTNIGVGAEYNWYFQNHALNGWFAGPGVQLSILSFKYEYTTWNSTYTDLVTRSETATGISFGIGGQGGYRWIWDNGFTVDAKIGLFVNIGGAIEIAGATAPYAAFGFAPGGSIGYAW